MTLQPFHTPTQSVSGRYAIFFAGHECGAERWSIEQRAPGLVVTGEQEMVSPHPFPNRQEYRATLSPEWRLRGLEILWTVGSQKVRATHAADAGLWRVRIEIQGHVREQEGEFPDFCEVEYCTHLFNAFILARRDFGIGGEHEFPVLRIGPPYMAVSPERMLYRCVEGGMFDSPVGRVRAKRYVVSIPPASEETGYTLWADEEGFVLESYEGIDPSRPWMRLTHFERSA